MVRGRRGLRKLRRKDVEERGKVGSSVS